LRIPYEIFRVQNIALGDACMIYIDWR